MRLDSELARLARVRLQKLVSLSEEQASPLPVWKDQSSQQYVTQFMTEMEGLLSNQDFSSATNQNSNSFYSNQGKRLKSWRKSSGALSRLEKIENYSPFSSSSSLFQEDSFNLDRYLVEREVPELQRLFHQISSAKNFTLVRSFRDEFGSRVRILLKDHGEIFLQCHLNHCDFIQNMLKCCIRTLHVQAAVPIYEILSEVHKNNVSSPSLSKLLPIPSFYLIQHLYNLLKIAKSRRLYKDGKRLFEISIPVLSAIISDSPGKDLHPDNSLLFAIIRKGISLQLRCLLIDLQEDLAKSSLITTKTMSSWINVRTNLIEISKVVTNPVIESFFMQFSQRFAKRIEEDSDHLQRDMVAILTSVTRWNSPHSEIVSLIVFILHQFNHILPEDLSKDLIHAIIIDSNEKLLKSASEGDIPLALEF
eukprot:gene6770-7296_t